MTKRIKMIEYGEPGVGKSTFATKAPKPFWIATDGNYAWLDLPEKDHVEVDTWEQAKAVFADIESGKYAEYETIVVDLLEDLFKFCEYEFCKKNGLTHVSDLGYGKGYDISRNEFFIEIAKLLGTDKNIILIMHGLNVVTKDRRGVEFTKYVPSNRLPDKVLDLIEGRVMYCLRAFAVTEENADGHLITKRYLSLSPDGTTEYGICRKLREDAPRYIDLNWNSFIDAIGLDVASNTTNKVKESPIKATPIVAPTKDTIIGKPVNTTDTYTKPVAEEKPVTVSTKLPVVEEDILDEEPVVETPKVVEKPTQTVQSTTTNKSADIAALKAKLAAIKASQGK